ncbi:type I restriction endonuclease subunit R [Algoriphagus hitonicola]|uniref:Type I restriction enzyme endonuclease subunit n=1 Tax=Algoriphagus hitonicola TaxID=435880 RepID=A0A1I2SBG4_9BACT|nr:type I restriction endonuclease subunit R [Algoriphagus hitonicola]SFG49703.1 type I restriction enzyme, R subunit [Algoriphagus hitonicola]
MSNEYSEDNLVEASAQQALEDLGWTVKYAWQKETFGENSLLGRDDKSEVILKRYLLKALIKFNPGLPNVAYQHAIDQITQKAADKTLVQLNKEKYTLLTKGVDVSFTNEKGELVKKKLQVFDFENSTENDFLAVRQLEVVGELYNRRPDVIGFVNGIPLVFFELKAHHTDLRNAYTDNLTDYKDTIPHVFHSNAFIILSNGTDAKIGSVTSPYKFFNEWKRIEEDEEGIVSLDTILRGTCDRNRLMDLFENFILFDDSDGDLIKIIAKNHQFIGVNKVLNKAKNIEELKGKLGVFWHTQGSGKSYSMVFIAQKIHRKFGGSYTFLLVTDRTELERQLYDTFTGVGAVTEKNVIAGSKKGISGREHLRELLSENHRYVFSLIHKFSIDPKVETEYPLITDRSNIIVISDEAHRTQAGTFARNMRFHGIPNASYLGFTGTPIIKEELELTKNIFGEYVSVYDFKRAIDDGATLPLRYLNRGEKLGIENPQLDEKMAELIENEDLDEDQRRKLEREFKRDYPVLTSEKRLDAIAKDLVWHFNERGYQGKAMFVALDKPTAVRMYDLVMKYWPDYVADLKKRIENAEDQQEELQLKRKLKKVEETEVCVVVSSEQNEVDKFRKMKLEIAPHRKKIVERDLEKEFKDEENPFRLAIVCAMWITGFDAPCVSTVYLDKPIKGHTLMQTIARANRVYDDEKENGLIVDYGNVYKQLEKAYSVYGEGGDKGGSGTGGESEPQRPVELLEKLAEELQESIRATKGYLKELGFNLSDLMNAKPMEKLAKINQATDAVCLNETTRAKFEIMARDVFRKYKALYPEEQIKPFIKQFNAIEAIYDQLNQKVKTADIIEIMLQLQTVVNESVFINEVSEPEPDYIDLSNLDFDKLKAAFAKVNRKNTMVFDLQQAIEKKLKQMVKENPLRLEFYEKYKEIIEEYNNGKDINATKKAFDDLSDFLKTLSEEDSRAIREGLDEETLAIFDLLKKDNLKDKEIDEVKKVAKQTLDSLKAEKLKIERWRESTQLRAQVKTTIYDTLLWLPQEPYSEDEVNEKTNVIYQHIFTNYPGGGQSVYNTKVA